MKRDALIVPLNENMDIIIACDNSGSIGMKQADDVSISYDMVSYFAFRVAYMECVVAGGVPFAVTIQNFNDEMAWDLLKSGIQQGIDELGIPKLPVTGSTESNFSLTQSATGITVLGKRHQKTKATVVSQDKLSVAVIGSPLVGDEVIRKHEAIAPLNLFQWCCEQDAVLEVVPVGSKGILFELKQIFPSTSIHFLSDVNMEKSSGPATCFIVVYSDTHQEFIKAKAGKWFHGVDAIDG